MILFQNGNEVNATQGKLLQGYGKIPAQSGLFPAMIIERIFTWGNVKDFLSMMNFLLPGRDS